MSDPRPLAEGPPTLADLWEILRLPALLALAAVAASWLVWYFTSESCTMALAQVTGCNPSRLAQYINLDALNKIAAHGVVAGSGGGLWSYAMITRERRAREDLVKQLAEERQRSDAQLAEERQRSDERLTEERQRSDARLAEERRQFEERLAEERRQAADERRQLMSHIEHLIHRNGDQQNGDGGPTSQ